MPRPISQDVSLTPEQGQFVRAQMTSGRHQTVSEVVRDGLRLLQERDSAHSRFGLGTATPEGSSER